MIDLKLSEEEKKDMMAPSSVLDRYSYPGGLKIHLDDETYAKLNLGEAPKVGEEFVILAKAVVEDVHQNKRADDQKHISVGLQLTEMDIKKGDPETKKETEQVLYGG